MKTLFARQWFLICLAAALVVGFRFATPLAGFAQNFPVPLLVAFVLFLMAWTLDADALRRAVTRPQAAALGVTVNIVLLPALAWLLGWLLVEPLNWGLALAAAVPCTLASAVVWTRRAGGNDAVALMVTMITNVSCFITTPLLFWLLTGKDAETGRDPWQMVLKLMLVVVLPMVLGQALRLVPAAARWATAEKRLVAIVAQAGILTMVLVGAVNSALKLEGAMADGGTGGPTLWQWVTMIVVVIVLHVVVLWAGCFLGRLTGLARSDWIAVGIAGSQKTLMVGLYVGLEQDLGVGLLPMLAYHAVQLLIDTPVADWLHRRGASAHEVPPASAANLPAEEAAP
ncbi:MAG: hypothetical protein DWQ35_19470 [Planctomycetota bacterium]|nr:MAG: hypothetical protein DWQ35_19470 [Planctomycetota bacterium]REK23524.1 MAG: hypothetical protein DWQ42_15295 [Planctomycetota bacterium]REK40419.1 MAG: hypothetical protein DWQ46_16480 [Planctomycetota bacterium]